MITIELRDISKLPGYIRIPSMVEGSEATATIAQKILYLGLSNQCRKCRRFGHLARTCVIDRKKPWEGASTPNLSNAKGENGKKAGGAGAPQPNKVHTEEQLRTSNSRRHQEQSEAIRQAGHPNRPNTRTSSVSTPNAGKTPGNTRDSSESLETDQAMADPTSPPPHRQDKPNPTAKTRPESPSLKQPNFGFRTGASHQEHLSTANSNSFAMLETFDAEEEGLKRTQEDTGERWIFQASRKQAPRLVSPGKAPPVATLALGLRPRQKGLQGCGLKGSLGVTSETPGSEGECEGVSHHTFKATPTLGDGVPVGFRKLQRKI
jgi:hypothetical protein